MKNFDEFLNLLREYRATHNNTCQVPQDYVAPNGCNLGVKVMYVRSIKDRLSKSDIRKLDRLGFVWKVHDRAPTVPVSEIIKLLEEYKATHDGSTVISEKYVTENGIKLGKLINNIRSGDRKITEEERKALCKTGINFYAEGRSKKYTPMYVVIERIKQYVEEHGNCDIPRLYVTDDGIRLGHLVFNIRYGHRKISDEDRKILDSLGFIWKYKKYKQYEQGGN